MLYSILALFLASLLSAFFYKKYQYATVIGITSVLVGIIVYFSYYLNLIIKGGELIFIYGWIDSLNIQLSFYLDGLSLFFALLITIFGLLVFLYSFKYMEEYPKQGRFFSYLLLFMGSMLGVVLASNTISLFVFWELTSFSSFLLIGFNNQQEESRRAARQALLVTSGGGLALMSGFILLEIVMDSSYSIIGMLNQPATLEASGLLYAAIVLIAIGAITKSAQFPFHFWLPNAMAAPTPVSAYLHSATMVKAGVYLIFRLNPLFQEIELWGDLLGIVGALTMVWGAFKSFQEDDLKRILAYTTISALGIFFMMTGVGGEEAINAALVYVLAHALYKGALFLAAGSIDHQTGTRSLSQLSDLVRKMPYTAVIIILSTASMAGVIPFIGFIGKESLYDALYHTAGGLGYLALLFLASVFFTAVAIDIVYNALLKEGKLKHNNVNEASKFMVIPPLILGAASLMTGIMPSVSLEPLLRWSAAGIYQLEPSMHLKLWHGFNQVFLLSVVTIISGVGLYFLRQQVRTFNKPNWLRADFLYDRLIKGIESFSKFLTGLIQNGYLRDYIALVLLTFSVLMLYVLANNQFLSRITVDGLFQEVQIYEIVIIAFITMAVIFLFQTSSRLIVTATFGIIGYSIALAYTLFSAPDVAITQFLAETLTLMLLILILHRLPSYTLKKPIAHIKYLPLSIVFGVIMTLSSFMMLEQEKDSALKSFFLEKAVSEGKGQNAVNVILVDFRALDTFGEITVLAVTMVGIIALLTYKTDQSEL